MHSIYRRSIPPQKRTGVLNLKLYALIKNNRIFYLTGFLALFGMKYFYSRATVNSFTWILAPTVWWVQTLSGIPFHFVPCEGYVNHTHQFVIALSCSGVQFMTIAIATLLFPFIHQMSTSRKKTFWMAFSFMASYILTIVVNTIRILLSIFLPVIVERRIPQKSLPGIFLTPARLHTLIGIFVYFTSLFIIYHLAGLITRLSFRKYLPPVFFYLALVLGVPFLNGALKNRKSQFLEYTLLVLIVCLTVVSFCRLVCIPVKIILKNIKKLL